MSACDWGPGPLHGCDHGSAIERNSWGWAKVEDTHYRRISTVAGELDNKGGITNWTARNVVRGLGLSRALRDRAVVAANAGDEDEIAVISTEAQEKGGSNEASQRGTTVHDAILPALVTGIDPMLDDEALTSSLRAARMVLAEAGLEAVMCEQFVVNTGEGHAGTWDLLLRDIASGAWFLGDAKSSAKLNDRKYPHKVAVQLACYTRGRRWCPFNGWLRTPAVDQERGFLLSLPLDTGEAYLDALDLTIGWNGLHHAQDVNAWKKTKPLLPGGLHVVASTDAPARSSASADTIRKG